MYRLPGAAGTARVTTIEEARSIVGTFSRPSKMPGNAYGLPAKDCIIGKVLAKIPGSVCSSCYALKGHYVFPNVRRAQETRLASLQDPRWVEAMVLLLHSQRSEYFRWHDSGDLQGLWHLENICEVAVRCPNIKFWLPTRERVFVRQYLAAHGDFPGNLCVRVSGTMIDGPPPGGFPNTSTVSTGKFTCPSSRQGNKCLDCRACWDRGVANVAYKKH